MANYELKSENSEIKVFEVFNNFFNSDFLKVIYDFNNGFNWRYENSSDTLYTSLNDIDFFENDCLARINEVTGIEHELYRCYRNGMIKTSTSRRHYDTHHKGDRTLLFYGHHYWENIWGGETAFGENDEMFVKPIPNSAVYFSARHHPHCVRPQNHMAKELRITYVWKLKSP